MDRHTSPGNHSVHAHPVSHGKRRRSTGRWRRLILWEWIIVIGLLSGLVITILAISRGPDPKRQADALVEMMKSAAAGRPLGDPLFDTYPSVTGSGREVLVVMSKIPPKVCVLASWELYRLGTVTVNNVTPQRVSAAKMVELCNAEETATLFWSPRPAE